MRSPRMSLFACIALYFVIGVLTAGGLMLWTREYESMTLSDVVATAASVFLWPFVLLILLGGLVTDQYLRGRDYRIIAKREEEKQEQEKAKELEKAPKVPFTFYE
jgi:TRAP-type C4-dicarboxylate transport system permease small subunit